MSRYRCAVFDLDGTLVDSGPGIIKSVKYALSKFGIEENDPARLAMYIGPPLEETFAKLCGFTDEQCSLAVKYYREVYVPKNMYETTVYGGIPEALARLDAGGVACTVASNKPPHMVAKMLEYFGLASRFRAYAGCDEHNPTKTAAIMSSLKSMPDLTVADCVMIGDRYSDAHGAAECGMDFIAALYGFGVKQEFEPYPTAFYANTPAEAADYILG